ncbi:MAG: hypothetical protein K0Q95_112 [Bacteroidota bacterium]|jgi:hypothetical protein|nr:hypothetical protein [Bacteroidota bacterium]
MRISFVLLLCLSQFIYGQRSYNPRADDIEMIVWQLPQPIIPSIAENRQALYFAGAHNNTEDLFLPRYFQKISSGNSFKANISLTNQLFTDLSIDELVLLPKNYNLKNEIDIRIEDLISKKESYTVVSFIPLRRNMLTGKIEKLISFKLQVTPSVERKAEENRSPMYAANSVLQSGNWHKISVANDGIFKLDQTFLQSIGMNTNSIDPRNIRIYGNGGGMLPELNSISRIDDLAENAIYVEGENDGVFNSADYVLFYGKGPDAWNYDSGACPKFSHVKNIFSDSSYYFITSDLGPGKRIQSQASTSLTPTNNVFTFDDHAFHEKEDVNLLKSGKEWYGEYLDLVNSYNFPFSFPNIDLSSQGTVKVRLASRYDNNGNGGAVYNVSASGTTTAISTDEIVSENTYSDYASIGSGCFTFSPINSSVNVSVSKQTPNATAWIDYLEANVRRGLNVTGSQLSFRDALSMGTGNVTKFNLTSQGSLQIWEVTDPLNVRKQSLNVNGSNYDFTLSTDNLREFVAFNGSSFFIPGKCGKVSNQNLHAISGKDLIIITAPEFNSEASRLASHHETKDSLRTIVVTTSQIYNEFSSGSQDVAALRDFVRMLYKTASAPSEIPRYLLLFGDASYDYKKRITNNTNLVPVYESDNSLDVLNSYCTDDFFGLLDDNEGLWTADAIDLGIGRIVAKTKQEATEAVNKILLYTQTGIINSGAELNSCSATAPPNPFGDWRNYICFVGDDQDNNVHLAQTNNMAAKVDTLNNNLNIEKIYLDAYQEIQTSQGNRNPDATKAIEDRISKGCLILNFTGYGGRTGWTNERVLETSEIDDFRNRDKLLFYYAATAEFSRFDDPGMTAGGEVFVLNPNGGAIAGISATRLTFSGPNFALNNNFYSSAFLPVNGRMPRLGDIYKSFKNSLGGNSTNSRGFVLLGDPALRLAYPLHKIITDSINSISATITDTTKALASVTVNGHLTDNSGNILNTYNGVLYPTVFDKKKNITTLSNGGPATNPPYTFSQQTNILFRGKVSVTHGRFSFSYIVPKDIDSTYGFGRISYYADNGTTDASGAYENFYIGGKDMNAVTDNTGPEIRLYMNDTKFAFGGLTDENPDLFALLKDEHGLNTYNTTTPLKVILDANTPNAINLNDYYRSDLNTYKSGSVRYPFSQLSDGKHTLELHASDVYNNTSKSYLEFVVAKSAEFALTHILNYPNPFTTHTTFYFEQNRCCQALQLELQIFTISGKLVRNFNQPLYVEGYRSDAIEWDGRDDFGDKIGKGVYIYHLKVKTMEGQTAEKYEKLVILN